MNSAVFHFATQDHEISHSKATSYEQKSPTGAAVSSFAPLKSSTALSSTLNPQRSLQAGEMAGYLPHDNGVMTRNDFGHEQQDHQSASSLGISSPPQNGISSSFVDQLIPQPSTISSTFTQKPVTQQSASTLSRHQQNYNMHQYGDSMSADSPQISSVDTNSGATSSVTFQQIPPRSDSAMSGETVTPGDSPLALRTGRWTNEEHQKFLDGLRTHGRNWKAVALMVQTRSTVQIRTHAQKYFLKEARQLDHQLRSGVETVIMNSPANGDSNIVIADTGVQLPISALRASIKAEERSALLQARRASTSSTNSAGRLRHAQMYGVDHGPRSVGGLASRGGAGAGFEPTPFDLRFSREEDFGYDGRPQPQRMTPQQQTYPYQDDDVCLVAGCTCPKSVRQAEGQNQMEYMQQQRQKQQQQRNSAPNHVLHDTMARSAPLSTHGLTEHAQQYFRQAESFQKGTGAGTAATQSIPYGVGLHPIHSIKEGMDYLNDDVDESGAKTGGRTPEQMSLHFSGVSAAVAKSMQHNEQNINIFAGQPERQQQQHQQQRNDRFQAHSYAGHPQRGMQFYQGGASSLVSPRGAHNSTHPQARSFTDAFSSSPPSATALTNTKSTDTARAPPRSLPHQHSLFSPDIAVGPDQQVSRRRRALDRQQPMSSSFSHHYDNQQARPLNRSQSVNLMTFSNSDTFQLSDNLEPTHIGSQSHHMESSNTDRKLRRAASTGAILPDVPTFQNGNRNQDDFVDGWVDTLPDVAQGAYGRVGSLGATEKVGSLERLTRNGAGVEKHDSLEHLVKYMDNGESSNGVAQSEFVSGDYDLEGFMHQQTGVPPRSESTYGMQFDLEDDNDAMMSDGEDDADL